MKVLELKLLIFLLFCSALLFGQSSMQDSVSQVDQIFVHEIVDVNPEPMGGYKEIYLWISKNLDVSDLDQMDTLKCTGSFSCKVYVQFTVSKEGNMIDHKIAKGIGGRYDSLSLATTKQLPTVWQPGLKDGKPVNTQIIIPISFIPYNAKIHEKKKRRK